MTKDEELEALARGDTIVMRVTEGGYVVKTVVSSDEEDDEPNIIDYLHDYHNYGVEGLRPDDN